MLKAYNTEYDHNTKKMKIYDNHTLYIELGDASREQLEQVLIDAINKIGIRCHYKINMINKKFKKMRMAYVRVSDYRVYNVLSGRNPDGTERVMFVDDETFEEPEGDYHMELDKALEGVTDWWEINCIEEDMENKYMKPQIKEYLDPLINFLPYDEQGNKFDIGRAYIYNMPEDVYSHIIKAWDVPKWLTEEIIRPYFASFVSDQYRYKDPIQKQTEFPIITLYDTEDQDGNEIKTLYIEFAKYSYDCDFAMLMSKILYIINPTNGQTSKLFFNYLKNKNFTSSFS